MQNVEYYSFHESLPMNLFGGPVYFFGRPLAASKTLEKIKSFSSLPVGWNYGDGGPIKISVIQRAIDLYWTIILQGVVRTDAFAGADGEILLTAYNGEHYLGIVIEQDGKMTFRHEFKDDDLTYIEADNISEIKIAIGEAVIWWNTYDFFIQRTSSVSAIGLMNYPLNVRSLGGYPSFIVNVWNTPGQLVITRGNFTGL
jgi:hypothetical protein